jgi:hypothetical protein
MSAMNSLELEANEGVGNKKPWLIGSVAALALGAVISSKLKPEISDELRAASLLPYCEDIVEVLNSPDATKGYALVGGLPIDAFNHPDSLVDVNERIINVSANFDTLLIRDNGSTRDFDNLLLFEDEEDNFRYATKDELDKIKAELEEKAIKRAAANNQPSPEMSVFSFDTKTSLFHTATMLDEDGRIMLRQGLSEYPLPEDSLQTWDMLFPSGQRIKVLNPWEQYWRSMTRFPSGMKHKDLDKLTKMHEKLMATPGLAEMEYSKLCLSYNNYLDRMVRGNSFKALAEEALSVDRQMSRIGKLGLIVTARTFLEVGEKNQFLSKFVQQTPQLFNAFVGSK